MAGHAARYRRERLQPQNDFFKPCKGRLLSLLLPPQSRCKRDCARPATTPPVGMPKALARLHPMCNDLVKTPARGRSKAGSDSQPEPAMSALSELSPASRALLLSQAGPLADSGDLLQPGWHASVN